MKNIRKTELFCSKWRARAELFPAKSNKHPDWITMEEIAAEIVNIILRDVDFLLKGKSIKGYIEYVEGE